MVARIHFTLRGEPLQATLDDDGTWSCADPDVRRFLNEWRPLPADATPESVYGRVLKAAKTLNGRVEFTASASAKSHRFEDAAKKESP